MACNEPSPCSSQGEENRRLERDVEALRESRNELLLRLERNTEQFEALIRWALDGGLDPHDVYAELDEDVERLLWTIGLEEGWRPVTEEGLQR